MPEVKAFAALRYQPDRVGGLDRVLCPPYDVISPEERDALAGKSSHNAVHLVLAEKDGGASRTAARSRRAKVLVAKRMARLSAGGVQRVTDTHNKG